jgi:type II secretory pathway component GspD/PulD (secretin)
MKATILALSLLIIGCSSQRDPGPHLKEWNYTNDWYYTDQGERLQVYKTRTGKRFVFELNKKQTHFIRKFIN